MKGQNKRDCENLEKAGLISVFSLEYYELTAVILENE